jgi:hypothetical protein
MLWGGVCEVQMDVFDTGQNGESADAKETVDWSGIVLLASYSTSRLLACFLPRTTTKQPSQGQQDLSIKPTTLIPSPILPSTSLPHHHSTWQPRS